MDKSLIMLEMVLYFDNDAKMDIITDEIGLQPSDKMDKKDRRKSPFKDDNLEAYWIIQTEYINTFYFEDVSKVLIDIIKPYIQKIKTVTEKYSGEVDFCIVPKFKKSKTPALCFNREFLDVVNYLSATVQIDMYVE